MRTLPTRLRSDHFDFTLIAREADIALFRKTKGSFETFEVIRVQSSPDHIGPRGILISASEHFPSSEQWGTHGWSYQTVESAWDKFHKLLPLNA